MKDIRKPGGSRLVYDRTRRTIRKETINRWARLWWNIKYYSGYLEDD